MAKTKALRIRCWIDVNGAKFFGPGPAQLLTLIDECGSITEAAKQMKMSYKKAWDLVNNINRQAEKPFVTLKKGGEKGGGAALTTTGKKVISEYQVLTKKLDKVLQSHKTILKSI
jgi:molybdate transport system regulatory protein